MKTILIAILAILSVALAGVLGYQKLTQPEASSIVVNQSATNQLVVNQPMVPQEQNTAPGSLSISLDAENPPVKSIAKNYIEAEFLKVAFNANSTEDIKINSLIVSVEGKDNSENGYGPDLIEVKLFDGAKMLGISTQYSDTVTFSNLNWVIPKGTKKVLTVKATVPYDSPVKSARLVLSRDIEAVGLNSKQKITITGGPANETVDGNWMILSEAKGTISVTVNKNSTNWSATNPTGKAGDHNVLLGSFIVNINSFEGVDITSFKVQWSTTGTNNSIQDLKLYKGTKEAGVPTGLPIGDIQAHVSANTNYGFYLARPDDYIHLSAGGQFVLNIYGNILTSSPGGNQGKIVLSAINGVGKITGYSIETHDPIEGPAVFIVPN